MTFSVLSVADWTTILSPFFNTSWMETTETQERARVNRQQILMLIVSVSVDENEFVLADLRYG